MPGNCWVLGEKMSKYTSRYWSVVLPEDWQGESDDESDVLYAEEGYGELCISADRQDKKPDDDFLKYLAEEHISAGAQTYPVKLGDFNGFTLSYDTDEEYWIEWYLCSGNVVLFATYQCQTIEEGIEDEMVRRIMGSLRGQ